MKSTVQLKNRNSTLSHHPDTRMLCAFAKSASGQSGAGWRLSGGNTAEGQSALFSRTTGGFNTAVGFLSLRNDTTGNFTTAVGARTLLANTGTQNTATGAGTLLSNTIGGSNTANGTFALFFNTTGNGNTAMGASALLSSTGLGNTALGGLCLQPLTQRKPVLTPYDEQVGENDAVTLG